MIFVPDVPAEGDLRLASGSADNEGRVEIFMNGTFYTACRDDWDQHDTNVVCRQLNLPFSRESANNYILM